MWFQCGYGCGNAVLKWSWSCLWSCGAQIMFKWIQVGAQHDSCRPGFTYEILNLRWTVVTSFGCISSVPTLDVAECGFEVIGFVVGCGIFTIQHCSVASLGGLAVLGYFCIALQN